MLKWIKKLFVMCRHDYKYDMESSKVVHNGKLMFKFGDITKICKKCKACEVVSHE
jgi:hypothetical protein